MPIIATSASVGTGGVRRAGHTTMMRALSKTSWSQDEASVSQARQLRSSEVSPGPGTDEDNKSTRGTRAEGEELRRMMQDARQVLNLDHF
ncbi:hypothetical protein C370_07243 [Cryptococcus neoformans A1-35-8]|nr:hypothetical protein C369_07378 [Cryptococcus neoformans var. grubii A5-35-17]OXH01358.1 hypothetical protein C370_07243 [Cryptococcus neoformans var. grubii A1-35-8]